MANVVLPGDWLEIPATSQEPQIVGYGIEKDENRLVCRQPGLLRQQGRKTWISVQGRRYTPVKGDRVLGVVVGRQGDFFKVDIGAADFALVSFLFFEGATKRNRPNLKTGDLLYAQVVEATRHLDTEMTCIDNESRARGLGLMPAGGFVFKVPLHVARRVLSPVSQLLKILGSEIKFEVTCGVNGRIWLKSANPRDTAAVARIIKKSEYVLEADIPKFVDEQMRIYKGFA